MITKTLTLNSEFDGGGGRGADAVVGGALVDAHFLAAHRVEIQDRAFQCFGTVR